MTPEEEFELAYIRHERDKINKRIRELENKRYNQWLKEEQND